MNNPATTEFLAPLERMTRDEAAAALTISDQEARFLVDRYYSLQHNRQRTASQLRASKQTHEPNLATSYFLKQDMMLESQAKRALDKYAEGHPMGAGMRSTIGIGPVISAGLLANIDITRSPTAGHIWSYAGLVSTITWQGAEKARTLLNQVKAELGPVALQEIITTACMRVGRREENYHDYVAGQHALGRGDGSPTLASLQAWLAMRPWNANLKVLCWKAGESWVKFSGRQDCFYGKLYLQRKAKETEMNKQGAYREIALAESKRVGKDTQAYQHNIEGRLPPGHIHARSKRWAVKLFLSHLQQVWYETHFGVPAPKPFVIAHLGHKDFIPPVNYKATWVEDDADELSVTYDDEGKMQVKPKEE